MASSTATCGTRAQNSIWQRGLEEERGSDGKGASVPSLCFRRIQTYQDTDKPDLDALK